MNHTHDLDSTKVTAPIILGPSWQEALKEELAKPYLVELAAFLASERAGSTPIYPPEDLVFSAFHQTPYQNVKVVIIGQDPYHGPGQAHGLSFSVPRGMLPPPSLKNMFKELHADLGIPLPEHGCLERWATQGVLLLNAVLTVRQGEPASHHKRGWERFTDAVIEVLCSRTEPLIFVLLGKFAEQKWCHLNQEANIQHHVIVAAHPSPFSAHRGFFGSRPFSKINYYLIEGGSKTIDWEL